MSEFLYAVLIFGVILLLAQYIDQHDKESAFLCINGQQMYRVGKEWKTIYNKDGVAAACEVQK